MSPTISELAKALSAAQGEMDNPVFDSENPHFKSRYASLAAVRNAVIPIFSKHGLGIMQPLTSTDRGIRCGVFLSHTSGEWINFDPLDVPATKLDAQGFMSAATYAKRGTLQAIACVVGDEDDDGNVASTVKVVETSKEEKRTETKGGPATKGQKDYMETLFKKSGYKTESDKAAYWKSVTGKDITAAEQLSSNEAHMIIESLKALINPA